MLPVQVECVSFHRTLNLVKLTFPLKPPPTCLSLQFQIPRRPCLNWNRSPRDKSSTRVGSNECTCWPMPLAKRTRQACPRIINLTHSLPRSLHSRWRCKVYPRGVSYYRARPLALDLILFLCNSYSKNDDDILLVITSF